MKRTRWYKPTNRGEHARNSEQVGSGLHFTFTENKILIEDRIHGADNSPILL
jgi:hypothetical protein